MFGKLREKLKSWVKKVSEETKEKIEETPLLEKTKEKVKQSKKEEKNHEEKTKKSKKELRKELKEQIKPIEEHEYIEPEKKKFDKEERKITNEIVKDLKHEEKTKKGFFTKIFSKSTTISEKDFQNYSEDLEMILLENNVALEVAEKIIQDLKLELVGKEITKKELEQEINTTLKEIIKKILIPPFDLIERIKSSTKKPYTILFCGVNGTGKTTTIAKFAHLLKKQKISCVLGAGDTFRAASIEQLKKHGEKVGVQVIAHEYGSDPASVGFDAIKYAEKNKIDCVIIDTAGRMHTATNLLKEMEKIKRICKPDLTIFTGESITGNDATEQVKAFNNTIGIDAIILSKADIDEKGGTALSVGYTTNKPIIYLGTGQNYEDIEPFDKNKFIEKLGL
jgi:fused signal recognition particle receptor